MLRLRSWCGSQVLNLGNTPPGFSGTSDEQHHGQRADCDSIAQDGVINSASASFPLRGTTFNSDGTTRPFQYGSALRRQRLAPLFMKGSEGKGEDAFIQGYLLRAPVRPFVAYAKTTFDFTDDIEGGLDVVVRSGKRRCAGRSVPR